MFDGARFDRTIDVDLAQDARLVFAEAVVFGRTGMGEAVKHGFFADRWRVRRGGALVFAETVRLDGAIAAKLGEAAASSEDPRSRLAALGRAYLDFAASNRGMYELMFRHDLLESGRLGLREVSVPLFRTVTTLVAAAQPPAAAAPEVVTGALWANLHGIAQLWVWGSLQLATGITDSGRLLEAAIDAHLGPKR